MDHSILISIRATTEEATREVAHFASSIVRALREVQQNAEAASRSLSKLPEDLFRFYRGLASGSKQAIKALEQMQRLGIDISQMNRQMYRAIRIWAKEVQQLSAQYTGLGRALAYTYTQMTSLPRLVMSGYKLAYNAIAKIVIVLNMIRTVVKTVGRVFWNMLILPFKSLEFLASGLRRTLFGIYNLFATLQYQLFMQFMNYWMYTKTLEPVLETYVEFMREIHNIWTLLGKDAEDYVKKVEDATSVTDLLVKTAVELGRAYGKTFLDVARGMYDLVSAGVTLKELPQATELALKAARAGVTDVATAVKAGITAVRAFSL